MSRRLTTEEVSNRIKEQFISNVVLNGEYKTRREPLPLKCLDCGYEWAPPAASVLYINPNNASHVCPSCNRTGLETTCGYCGKKIYRCKSDVEKNKSGYFYCSIECGNRHKNELREENGEWLSSSSTYRRRTFENNEHKCLVCGWDEDYRLLEAHHIDSDRGNNSNENLCLLCPLCHRKITLGYYQLDIENKRLIQVK